MTSEQKRIKIMKILGLHYGLETTGKLHCATLYPCHNLKLASIITEDQVNLKLMPASVIIHTYWESLYCSELTLTGHNISRPIGECMVAVAGVNEII